ncbi:3-phenylpropionate/cinnamic acid dioxygenase subunit beta [Robertmurraya yapensis]|uniref:3-phenylpropionate/cinnamic acid dioxygenase subunit beta n=2 Tax=Bacillaceae TaxID=186817 RepID=A0A431WAB1_9BACI|nr:3-phenylpropionate/cinnamic acid dioxygenase subunit beta [Bacillus yapensis]RTR32305.1 3-phenylpropionate/cinnamic acid dioxygenase subunit beta [Bacillus yapensis]TKS96499.1 3-phenylpropionate/cinnamic acid dioxygenase subunit beta [Bacillus yapensis]
MSSEVKKVTPELQMEITNLYYQEAYFLDNRKYKEWLELLTDDINYKMPMRETVEGVDIDNIAEDSSFFEETKTSLSTRVNRLYTKSAWVENPATRQRHFITNIVIDGTENPNEYNVRSYFLFKRSRGSTTDIEEMFGERNDIVRLVNNQWKIASRIVYPDQSVITTMNMSMFL